MLALAPEYCYRRISNNNTNPLSVGAHGTLLVATGGVRIKKNKKKHQFIPRLPGVYTATQLLASALYNNTVFD